MATSLDLLLIDGYTAGQNVPLASQAGYPCQANAEGTNVEFVGPQTITGSGVWNGTSREILVRGTGARTITLGVAKYAGYRVTVIDADGTAAGGDTITVLTDGPSIAGDQTISSDYAEQIYTYVSSTGSGLWACTRTA